MTISKIGGVFFTAITTVNSVTRERSEYLGGANVQNPPAYICWANNDTTVGEGFNLYNMTGQTGTFGFSTRIAVPGSFNINYTQGIDFHPSNSILALGGLSSPRLNMYSLTGGTSPLGTLLTNPSDITTVITSTVNKLRFSPDGSVLTIPIADSNCFASYNVTGSTSNPPLGTKLSNPGSFPTSATFCLCCGWHPDSNYLAIGATSATNDGALNIYPVSGSPLAYGTKIVIDTSGGDFRDVKFSPKGDMLIASTTTTNTPVATVCIFPWTGNGVGTRYINPTTFITSVSAAFSSDQKYVALAFNSPPVFRIYNWTGSNNADYGFGTEITLTTTLPGTNPRIIKWFGINDRYIITAGDTTPKANVYVWGANGVSGNIAYKLALPAQEPTRTSLDLANSFA